MSAHSTHDGILRTSAGQSVVQVTVRLDGVSVPVVPIKIAAVRLGYTHAHTRLLCDTGRLIAIKIDGRWWVLERSIEVYASTLRLSPQNTAS